MPDVNLTIDGRQVSVPAGTLVVEAAKKLGIEIPVFCYHHKLNYVGACRLCVVEITPGPPIARIACGTPVAEGMVVKTQTSLAVQARADVLEFELANHPLDCPVCDKGGECPLQDFTFRHGYPTSRIDGPRLHFKKPVPLSDKIALDRERCVLCYRCTRYYDEVAWEQELTTVERGVQSIIASQFDQPLTSIFSGNIIDLCPVGALTSRVWRFESRPWDMTHTESVCSKCAVGCSVTLWQRRGQLVRVTSHENDDIDEGWICDRGRFDYTDVNDPTRVRTPSISGRRSTWAEAINAVAAGVRGKGARLGVSLPQDITNEEAFLFRRLLDGPLKGAKVKMHGRTAIQAPAGENELRIKDIDDARVIVVVASDLEHDAPIVNLRVKKAVGKLGARLIVVYPDGVDFDRHPGTLHIRNAPAAAAAEVRKLVSHDWLKSPGGPVAILFGDGYGSENVSDLAAACADLASKAGGKVMQLYRATNERGALTAGVAGWDKLDGVEALLSWGPPPTAGIPTSAKFVAAWDHLPRDGYDNSVVLPATTFAERQGSYTNLEGTVQFLSPPIPVAPPLKEGWEVLCELGAALGLALDYDGILPIQRAIGIQPPAAEPAPAPVLVGPAHP